MCMYGVLNTFNTAVRGNMYIHMYASIFQRVTIFVFWYFFNLQEIKIKTDVGYQVYVC